MVMWCCSARRWAIRERWQASAVVVGVLELAQFGRGGQFGVVLVGDVGLGQEFLQPLGVRPGVVGAADASALAHVE